MRLGTCLWLERARSCDWSKFCKQTFGRHCISVLSVSGLFGELRCHLGECDFETPGLIEAVLKQFFDSRPAGYYKLGIHKLPERLREVNDENGQYLLPLAFRVFDKYAQIGKLEKSSETFATT